VLIWLATGNVFLRAPLSRGHVQGLQRKGADEAGSAGDDIMQGTGMGERRQRGITSNGTSQQQGLKVFG
jgi:hypothetical protein